MKTQKILVPLATAALLVWNTGCEKKETTLQDQADTVAKESGAAVKQATETVKETAKKAVDEVAQKAKEVAAPASAKAQELIDAAKRLVGEGRFQEALAKLKEVGGEKLSLSQQTMVDSLKEQIQKALAATPKSATDAADAAGKFLKK